MPEMAAIGGRWTPLDALVLALTVSVSLFDALLGNEGRSFA